MTLAAGTRLGPYEILSPLGAGGMGEVYRAKNARLGREVAVKVIPERLASDPDLFSRFEREARAVAALSHPNIVTIHDVGRDREISYAVTELLEGDTLRVRIALSPLAWQKAFGIAVSVADALAAAHSRGIIHRDVKADNVFLGHRRIHVARASTRGARRCRERHLLAGMPLVRSELVDLADGSQLWAGQYSQPLSEIVRLEEEIAGQISENLRPRLTGEQKERVGRRYTESAEAYRLYLQGRFFWTRCARTHALMICCAESDCRQNDRYRLRELLERSLVMLRRWRPTLVAFPVLLVAAALLAQGSKKFVVWPAADLKWEPLAGAPPGPLLATLWGDATKGAYAAIEKFPAGFSAPLHTHSTDHKVVVISGTWIHGEEGKPEVRLGAGSYLFQPSGFKHTTACDKASECIFFIESSGKFDIKMVEEAPAK